MHFQILGNPANRRVHFFQEALQNAGLMTAEVLSWGDFLDGESFADALSPNSILRIDSPERDFAFYRHCIARGSAWMGEHEEGERISGKGALQLQPDGSGLRYHRQCYLGFRDILEELSNQSEGHQCFPSPRDIIAMSDKRWCHKKFSEAKLSIPPSIEAHSYAELQQEMRTSGIEKVFIKPRHGSSAAGICAYRFDGNQEELLTSAVLAGERIFSSLRLRRHTHPFEIRQLIDWVYREGGHTEQWLPKMKVDGREFDLRIVVIRQKACHAIPRVSRHESPMTNLHFGNERGDVSRIIQLLGMQQWQETQRLAERAATLFPESLCVGVDLMCVPNQGPVLIEVNAFGDLLPGILWQGMNTYETQIQALTSEHFPMRQEG